MSTKTTDSVSDLARGLIAWYNFKKNGKALLITGNFPAFEVLFSVFEDVGMHIGRAGKITA
ncbi:MAG: hypothetical protein IJ535_12460 [Pseudobutyrivibrio sp.]|uniref:hypothetical protein n=1 Tax=Pseudobutyrivibrio sp. TaxID=2014367 RepID=UPI0025FA7A5A|nr:hypothetical protein [Pseudobutyrivibrio sp.]MBQ8490585.1 hypothetical protein [Pseudobutyrivibrio sp.]